MSQTAKARRQRVHAVRKAGVRFGLRLSDNDIHAIVNIIQSGIAICVERQSRRLSLWDLTYASTPIRVVYDSHRHEIVTFLNQGEIFGSRQDYMNSIFDEIKSQ